MCLYDLQKTFDSVEFPVLLKRLFDACVNSKTWHILCSWYTDCLSSVCVGKHVSSSFALGRGVWQGSILSPALFLLVMDPLLRQLQSLSIGATINNMYAGAFLHADDICTLASNLSSLEAQVTTVKKFTEENFLKLNAAKCELIIFRKSSVKINGKNLEVVEDSFPVHSEATCQLDNAGDRTYHLYPWFNIAFKEPGRPCFNLEVSMPFRASWAPSHPDQ